MDKPESSKIDTLPASDSLIPFISSNFWEPDNMNCPLSSDSSTICLISSRIAPSFCTSSIKRGHGLFKKNNLGSSLACILVNLSSKLVLLYSENSCLINVDFPTCLAPTTKVHLLFCTLSLRIGEMFLSIYDILILHINNI